MRPPEAFVGDSAASNLCLLFVRLASLQSTLVSCCCCLYLCAIRIKAHLTVPFFFPSSRGQNECKAKRKIKTRAFFVLVSPRPFIFFLVKITDAMCWLIILPILSYISYRLYQRFFPTPSIDPNGKYVLISGCDSGFGHGLAVELDRRGFNVLAGVLVADSVTSLTKTLSSKATVFRLDITRQEDIDGAFDLIESKTKVLHGLVNNAGITLGSYIDWTTLDVMRRVMDVNFFGHVAMTKKFLPLLLAKRDSRVVNICSVAGFLASSGMSSYSASKYALESFSDCLRREMAPWNLRVSIIEPGFMRTAILQGRPKSFSDFWGTLSSDAQERWGDAYLKEHVGALLGNALIKHAEDPIKVVRALEHAVMNTVPRIRYRPGWQSSLIFFPLSMLPAWFADWFLSKLRNSVTPPAGVSKQPRD